MQLSEQDRDAFEAHLASCAECTASVKSLSPVTHALAYVAPQHEPPSPKSLRRFNPSGANTAS